ncbi:hypothetical protein JCM33374_g1346 [Metschnikowia sp. JCM 33374]|nr:hypothetical protein JCM33374_g1346 [Metschnikowia sp. JCM 33374]
MTKVLKLFKMKLLKKTSGLAPKVSSTGLVAAATTNPTEPSGVTTQSKLYKITRKLSSKKTKPSSTEFSSSKSPSGAFETETVTKTDTTATTTTTTTTDTTTANETGSKKHTGQAFAKFSGLFTLDRPAKKTKQVFAKILVPRKSPQKDGEHSTQTVPTYTVDQSVNTEEVGAINNTSANHGELASGIPLERGVFHADFPLATQNQEVEGEKVQKEALSQKLLSPRTPP